MTTEGRVFRRFLGREVPATAVLRVDIPEVVSGERTTVFRVVAALMIAAKALQAPVKWTSTRMEGFVADAHGRNNIIDGNTLDDDFTRFMDLCVQCRACEAVCPSSVPFGHLMEGARDTLARETRYQPWWRRAGYRILGHHRLLLTASTALAVAQRARVVPRRLGLPRLPLRRTTLAPTGTDVWLFTGCVMDAWMRPVHASVVRVLTAARMVSTCAV